MSSPTPLRGQSRVLQASVPDTGSEEAPLDSILRGWDPLLVAIAAFILVSIGRIHQLVPILGALKPGMLTGGAMLTFFILSRPVGARWARLDRSFRGAVVAVALWTMLTVPVSIYPGVSIGVWQENVLQSCGLALIVSMAVRDITDIDRLVVVFVLGIAFYGVVVLRTVGTDLDVRLGSLFAYDTNDFAQLVVAALPLSLYLAVASRGGASRLCWGGLSCLFLLLLIKSGSRGGFLGLVAVACGAVLGWRAVPMRWRMGAVVAGAAFLLLFASSMFWDRVASIANPSEDYNVTEEGGRIRAWKRGIGYMMDNPVLGVGVGTFGIAEGTLSELALAARQSGRANVRWMAPHNSFVEVGAETGVPGLAIFVWLLLVGLRLSWRLSRVDVEGARGRVALLGGALFLSLFAFIVTAVFLSQAYAATLFLFLGLIAGLCRLGSTGSGTKEGVTLLGRKEAPLARRPL